MRVKIIKIGRVDKEIQDLNLYEQNETEILEIKPRKTINKKLKIKTK